MAKFSNVADIGFDTNILIFLAGLDAGSINTRRYLKSKYLYDDLLYILDQIKKGKIRAIISPTVYGELLKGARTHGNGTLNFIKNNNFYLVEVPESKKETFYSKVNKLTRKYCNDLRPEQIQDIRMKNSKPNFHYAPCAFEKMINKKGRIVPINDAIIMAQYATLGIPIVTFNTKDFTQDGRQDIISYINGIMRFRPSAKPYTPEELVVLLKTQKAFLTVEPDCEGYIKEQNDLVK